MDLNGLLVDHDQEVLLLRAVRRKILGKTGSEVEVGSLWLKATVSCSSPQKVQSSKKGSSQSDASSMLRNTISPHSLHGKMVPCEWARATGAELN